jgi:hypothetical protein
MMGYYKIDIPIDKPSKSFELFTVADRGYITYREGFVGLREKPVDFELHLAVCILQREHLPPELLEPLKQWARDNKTVLSNV